MKSPLERRISKTYGKAHPVPSRCPLCGRAVAVWKSNSIEDMKPWKVTHDMHCCKLGGLVASGLTMQEATREWNREVIRMEYRMEKEAEGKA